MIQMRWIGRIVPTTDGPVIKKATIAVTFALMAMGCGFETSNQATAQQTQWTQFRGQQFNPIGISKKLPTTWSETKNVEWKTDVPGRGWSSPIVAGGKVFITTVLTEGKSKEPQVGIDYSNEYVAQLKKEGLSDEEIMKRVQSRDIELPSEVNLEYQLLCFDLVSGKKLWDKSFYKGKPPVGRHRKNSFCSETPVTDGKHVYVYVTSQGLYCFDYSGNQVWKKDLKKYPVYLDFGTGASPILVENQVVIVNDNETTSLIASFDKTTGKELWRKQDLFDKDYPKGMPKSGWVTPFLWRNKLRTEIVTVRSGVAISFDLKGNELWRLKGMRPSPAASTFAFDGKLLINTGRGGAMVAMKPGAKGEVSLPKKKSDPLDESLAWVERRAGTYIPTALAYDGGLYVLTDKGVFSRFDLDGGEKTFKARIKPAAKKGKTPRADFTASPWAYNERVYCLSEQGDTYVFLADEDYELLHVNSLDGMCLASPAIVGDRLLIRTEGRLYSIRNMESTQK